MENPRLRNGLGEVQSLLRDPGRRAAAGWEKLHCACSGLDWLSSIRVEDGEEMETQEVCTGNQDEERERGSGKILKNATFQGNKSQAKIEEREKKNLFDRQKVRRMKQSRNQKRWTLTRAKR